MEVDSEEQRAPEPLVAGEEDAVGAAAAEPAAATECIECAPRSGMPTMAHFETAPSVEV